MKIRTKSCDIGITINLGEFNSIRLQEGVTAQLDPEESPELVGRILHDHVVKQLRWRCQQLNIPQVLVMLPAVSKKKKRKE